MRLLLVALCGERLLHIITNVIGEVSQKREKSKFFCVINIII